MGGRARFGIVLAIAVLPISTRRAFADDGAADRGRVAITRDGFLEAAWTSEAYAKALSSPAPNPEKEPAAYAEAFNARYGLHSAPFPNDGLPMGLKRAETRSGKRNGIQIDCLVCHGGSIGGESIVGLGNTTLDLRALLDDLTRADGRIPPISPFILNSSRGTVNAGMVAATLLAFRNPDLSFRSFPLPLGANFPELDVPAWWLLGRKRTMYQDGRTDADSVRTNMQFLMGELTRKQFEALEPTFRDVQAYLKSLKPPKYPFAIDREKSARGEVVFRANCAKCHGTYGPGGVYPNVIVPLAEIGTDPARLAGLSPRLLAHYNASWFAEGFPVESEPTGYQAPPLDGVWATAPYLHNGSVPTLHALLNSPERPSRFTRPPSTGFEHYDQVNVGWKFDRPPEPDGEAPKSRESKFIYDTTRFGLGNQGHRFGDKLSETQRVELIEFLKTL